MERVPNIPPGHVVVVVEMRHGRAPSDARRAASDPKAEFDRKKAMSADDPKEALSAVDPKATTKDLIESLGKIDPNGRRKKGEMQASLRGPQMSTKHDALKYETYLKRVEDVLTEQLGHGRRALAPPSADVIEDAFRHFDKDSSGKIDARDL